MTDAGPYDLDDDLNDPEGAAAGGNELPLPSQLHRLDNGLRVLSGRMDEHEDAVAEAIQALTTDLDDLRDDLDALVEKESEPKEDPVPLRWAARATREEWDNLIAWVDGLHNAYSLQSGYTVPACWIAHPGVVEQLASLYRGWVSAMLHDEDAGPDGSSTMAAWHDRWLWPALQRFKSGTHYLISNCKQRHTPENGAVVPVTDRSHLPSARAMAPNRTPAPAKPTSTTDVPRPPAL